MNESIKSPEETIRCEIGVNIGSEDPIIYHNTDRLITQSEAIKCMQSYSDQNLTEYKRRLKEAVYAACLKNKSSHLLAGHQIEELIESIYLNKK